MPPNNNSTQGLEAAVLAIAEAIKNSETAQTANSIKIGNILICWGNNVTGSIGNAAGNEGNTTINFPTAYASVPVVVASPSDWGSVGGEYCVVSGITTTQAFITLGHSLAGGSAQTMTARWIAIGVVV